jgi:alginate O-acetyltransferase complex protein AlgI
VVFSNPWFFLFLAAVLSLLGLPGALVQKKRILTVLSCLFYAAWDIRYLVLLLAISLVDYYCAKRISEAQLSETRGKWWVTFSIVSNLTVLGYFKYANFFLASVRPLIGGSHTPLSILLPAGISFYTFKTMSYVIDVYRKELKPQKSYLDYAMFITFFPELIAGPIVRASVFLPQMERSIGPSQNRLREGGSLFLIGFCKKVMADHLGIMVTPVFEQPQLYDTTTVWAALLGYTMQIHLDFSGYSDMAVGMARAMGYSLPENFNMPYLSRNLPEFWRRWHITLSTWLRDYLYIPLGGNRTGNTYFNLTVTMLLGGLWHGASWNFVLWGALHGLALAAHRLIKDLSKGRALLPAVPATCVTLLFVGFSWIPFRCTNFSQTWSMVRGLLGLGGTARWLSQDLLVITLIVIVGHWFATCLPAKVLTLLDLSVQRDEISGPIITFSMTTVRGAFVTTTLLLLVLVFALTQTTPFIYFQF